MNIRSLIISFSVIIGLSSCGPDSQIESVSTINAPTNVTAPAQTLGNVTFNFANDISASSGVNLLYTWDFGDGTIMTSDVAFQNHQYNSNGTYNVTLVVSDRNGKARSATIRTVVVIDSVDSGGAKTFSFTSNALEVSFMAPTPSDASATYSWNFGDNQTSAVANPVHIYSAPNVYTVELTVTGTQGNATYKRDIAVSSNANRPPVAIIASANTNFLDVDASAIGSSDPDGAQISYEWDFGDGTVKTNSSISEGHSYAAPGTYTITLTISDGELETISVQTITVDADPSARPAYYTLFEKAYDDFLKPSCANCHYDGFAISTGQFSMGTSSGSAITIDTAEQGLLNLLKAPNGFDNVIANPINGESGHDNVKLEGDKAQTWSDLMTIMQAYLGAQSNNAPVAVITSATSSGLTVSLDASGSSDVDNDSLNYAWSFGQGEGAASGKNATYTFTTAGDKTVTLMVTDGKGGSNMTSTVVTIVKPNAAPTPSFEFTTSQLTASFDASMSKDEELDAFTFAWDFGDGNSQAAGVVPTVSHAYANEGSYIVTLTLVDANNNQSKLEKTVMVSTAINNAPVAGFQATVSNLMVSLASTSTDPDGDSMTVEWVIDGAIVSTNALDTHMFTTSGTKSITLNVTDSRGKKATLTKQVVIGNQAPIANFSISKNFGVVTFDATSSTDPEKDNLTYSWDFGDGSMGTGAMSMHTYQDSKTYTVKLTVYDGNNDGSLERTVDVTLAMNSAPRASFTSSNVGDTYTFDASTSSDIDGDGLTYTWDFGYDNNSDTGVQVTHTFAPDADYLVTLTVSDGDLSDDSKLLVSTKEKLIGNIANGEIIYNQQCFSCHQEKGIGTDSPPTPPIAINRYLDHQADLYKKIDTTMPPSGPKCEGQCAADVEAYMMTWERVYVAAECSLDQANEVNYGPRQLRLLTSSEYANTVKALFDYDVDLDLLPQDDQIHFFSNHAKTSLNSTRLDAFESLAKKIVAYSVAQNFTNVKGFDEGFTDGVARRAFRRPLSAAEVTGYTALESSSMGDALQALLISPNFLFRSELGMSKAEFIDFNQNADPVYIISGTPTNTGFSQEIKRYDQPRFSHTFTGNDLMIIRVKGTINTENHQPNIWPDIGIQKPNNGGYIYQKTVDKSGYQTIKVVLNGANALNGNQQLVVRQAQSPHGNQTLTVDSITIGAAEQVIFDVPDIEDGAYALTPYEMATFIAYTYTGNTPDDALLDAANEGLGTQAAVKAQIERLLATDQAKEHFGKFVDQWLQTDEVLSVAKDADKYPDFTPAVRAAMHQEAREIFNDVMFNGSGFTSLFDSNYTFVNDVLANFYGTGGGAGANFAKVTDANRGGLLTSGAFLSSLAYPDESHLIKRAVRVRERVMCQHLPPFPTDVDLDAIRELQAQKVEDAKDEDGEIRQPHLDFINTDVDACKGCHEYIINPLGLALEDYDAVGLPRTQYANGLSVDLTGFDSSIEQHNARLYGINDLYETTDGVALSGVKSLGQVLSTQDVTRECLQEMAFRFVMDTGPDEFDHADKAKVSIADDERVNYTCAMNSMNEAMKVGDNPKEAFIDLGLSEIVRYRKEYNR